jgi:hypothetical protein
MLLLSSFLVDSGMKEGFSLQRLSPLLAPDTTINGASAAATWHDCVTLSYTNQCQKLRSCIDVHTKFRTSVFDYSIQ